MPIYAYECKDCGVRFERRQSFSDDPITVCPECEGRVHRLIQPAGIIFKGSGFYVTDNKGSKPVATTGTRKSSDKPEAKTGTKTESKETSSRTDGGDA